MLPRLQMFDEERKGILNSVQRAVRVQLGHDVQSMLR